MIKWALIVVIFTANDPVGFERLMTFEEESRHLCEQAAGSLANKTEEIYEHWYGNTGVSHAKYQCVPIMEEK